MKKTILCGAACLWFLLSMLVAAQARAATAPSQPYRWANVRIVAGGFVDGIVFNPAAKDVLYARTDIGGAYRWDEAAQRWVPLLDWLGPADWNLTGVESIGVDPADARRVYLAVGTYTNTWAGNGAILRSADQGRTWQRTDLPFKNGGNMDGRSAGERLAVDPNDDRILYFGSRDNGLWRSRDFGATWSQVSSFPVSGPTNGIGVVFVVFDPTGGRRGTPTGTLYAGVSQDGPGLYRSTDGGATWQAVPGQPTAGLLPHHGILTPGGTLFLTYGNAPGPNGMSDGAVWKWNTRTGAWTDITPVKPGNPAGFGYAGLAVDAQHPSTIMVATMDRWNPGDTLFRSTDGGATWADIGPPSVRDWSESPYVTFGASHAPLGWWLGALALDPFRPGHALYGTGATIWTSDDVTEADKGQPTHWHVGADGVEETAVLALVSPPVGPPLVSGLGDIGGFTHTDLAVSPPGGMMEPRTDNISSVDFAGQAPQIIARVNSGRPGQRGGLSHDGGATWTSFPAEPEGSRGRGQIAVSADGAALVWSQDGASPAMSHDGGATWTACTGLPRTAQVVSDRVDPVRFYGFDAGTGTLLVSRDAGASFTPVGPSWGTGGGQVVAAPDAAGDLWLTAGGRVSHSTDSGTTFQPVPTISAVRSLGFGKAAPGQAYPALYALGTVGGVAAIYRSDDAGAHWTRISDDRHQYATADLVIGDPRVYGRAYVGTNGRGILYGDLPTTLPSDTRQ